MKNISLIIILFISFNGISQKIPGISYVKKLPQEIQKMNGALNIHIPDETLALLKSESNESVSFDYEKIAQNIHQFLLENGLSVRIVYPQGYFGKTPSSIKKSAELLAEHDIRYSITYGISYALGAPVHSFMVYYNNDLSVLDGQFDFSRVKVLKHIQGKDLSSIKKDFAAVCKKSGFDISFKQSDVEPEILVKEDKPKGRVFEQLPKITDQELFIGLDSYRMPVSDDMNKTQKTINEMSNKASEDREKYILKMIEKFPNLPITTYDPSTEEPDFGIDDYVIEVFTSAKKVRTIGITANFGSGGASVRDNSSVDVVFFGYYYLKSQESNDIYFEHYGDIEGIESLEAFLTLLNSKVQN